MNALIALLRGGAALGVSAGAPPRGPPPSDVPRDDRRK